MLILRENHYLANKIVDQDREPPPVLCLVRSDFTKMNEPLSYESSYNLHECIMKITEEPQQYECKWGTALWYKAERISDTKVLITFTGGQFRKMMRTQYIMEFIPREQHTQIVLHFKKEMLGLPPMTNPLDIDLCMKQKINAVRIAT